MSPSHYGPFTECLPNFGGSRSHSYSHRFMTQIVLEGAHNVRDLDGLPAGAAVTRAGVLLRSDALDALTAADLAVLVDQHRLAHVIDLRSRAERIEKGRGLLGETEVRYSDLDVINEAD